MGRFAYLAPVGPFAGLSNAARQKIAERFPALSIAEIETAAESFLLELQASAVEPRLAEARHELNIFLKELVRFHGALNQVRKHRLDDAIGEASRMISGENEIDDLECSLGNLEAATRQTSRALPLGCPQLASRKLIARLAELMQQSGDLPGSALGDSLHSLVDLIFDDLMVGGDAATAVTEWQHSQAADTDHQRSSALLALVL